MIRENHPQLHGQSWADETHQRLLRSDSSRQYSRMYGLRSANKTLISPLYASISPFSLFIRLCKFAKLRARTYDPPRIDRESVLLHSAFHGNHLPGKGVNQVVAGPVTRRSFPPKALPET